MKLVRFYSQFKGELNGRHSYHRCIKMRTQAEAGWYFPQYGDFLSTSQYLFSCAHTKLLYILSVVSKSELSEFHRMIMIR